MTDQGSIKAKVRVLNDLEGRDVTQRRESADGSWRTEEQTDCTVRLWDRLEGPHLEADSRFEALSFWGEERSGQAAKVQSTGQTEKWGRRSHSNRQKGG